MRDPDATMTSERILQEPRYRPVLIRDMPDEQRPRERLRDAGPAALSDAELLAILLRTGTKAESAVTLASRLLAEAGGLDPLARVSHGELCAFHGFGEAKAAHLLAALELGRRIATSKDEEGPPTLQTSVDVARMMKPLMEFLPQAPRYCTPTSAAGSVVPLPPAVPLTGMPTTKEPQTHDTGYLRLHGTMSDNSLRVTQ